MEIVGHFHWLCLTTRELNKLMELLRDEGGPYDKVELAILAKLEQEKQNTEAEIKRFMATKNASS